MAKKRAAAKKTGKKAIEQYAHPKAKRVNNPPVGLVTPHTDPVGPARKQYAFDPHLDPQLVWAGKAERTSFEVPTVSLHVHERIDPKTIIAAVRSNGNGERGASTPRLVQHSLFDSPAENPPLRDALDFYSHTRPVGWKNRLIAGDSLLVMNSLLEKEGQAGKVQMIYIDPPYGIRYGSNFQPFVNRRDVRDGRDDDLTREPETLKAFRDTWELGIHSYLTYLRDRLLVARELLRESGSVFVQISDENLHHVRELMDEVFGKHNHVATIVFQKTGSTDQALVPQTVDFIVFYAKNKELVKYRRLFQERTKGALSLERYDQVLQRDGTLRRITAAEVESGEIVNGGVRAQLTSLTSARPLGEGDLKQIKVNGVTYTPGTGTFKTDEMGIKRLLAAGRARAAGTTLRYVRLVGDFPVLPLTDRWESVQLGTGLLYVVQTSTSVIQRCLLMTTDPGDLVLDPTCVREGTRVWVAEASSCTAPSPTLPLKGEGASVLPAEGTGASSFPPSAGGPRGGEARASRPTGNIEPFTTPSPTLPLKGEGAGRLAPIESVAPGDFVLAHDGLPHRVRRVIRKPHRGWMVRLQRAGSAAPLWLTADHRVLAKLRPRTLGGDRDWSGSPPEHLERRRELRREASFPERLLWSALRGKQNGFKFRRQHPLGPYIVDFYCRDAHLVVEIDGETHYSPQGKARDRRRDASLRGLGLDVLRIPATELGENLEGVSLAIQNQCRLRAESVEGARWAQAGSLVPGDVVFAVEGERDTHSPPLCPPADGGREGGEAQPLAPSPFRGRVGEGAARLRGAPLVQVHTEWSEETVYDLEVEGAHSFVTELCAVHNCGSGTTAYVAEQWGRRWITCDTSRVAITLARQRLMTAAFDYYKLAHPEEGVGSGFVYKTVPHVTLKSIANNPEIKEGMSRQAIDAAIAKYADRETLYDQPEVDRSKARVSGPFTVEAVPAVNVRPVITETESRPLVLDPQQALPGIPSGDGQAALPLAADVSVARSGETSRQAEWRDELARTGVRGKGGQKIEFARLEPLPAARHLHAIGETNDAQPKAVAISFGPEHAPLEQRQVEQAWEEARGLSPKPDILLFAAFHFDPEAAKDIDELEAKKTGMLFLRSQMNTDLLTEDLKKKRASNESFWLMGQPDVSLRRAKSVPDAASVRDADRWQIEIRGFDYYDPRSGKIESGDTSKIAMWLLDTDYDGRSLYPRQVFFPMSGEKDGWSRLAKSLKAEIDPELIEAYRGTESLPFAAGDNRRVAIKIVDDRGIESLKIMVLE